MLPHLLIVIRNSLTQSDPIKWRLLQLTFKNVSFVFLFFLLGLLLLLVCLFLLFFLFLVRIASFACLFVLLFSSSCSCWACVHRVVGAENIGRFSRSVASSQWICHFPNSDTFPKQTKLNKKLSSVCFKILIFKCCKWPTQYFVTTILIIFMKHNTVGNINSEIILFLLLS